MGSQLALTLAQRGLLAEARRSVLATIDPDGRPRLVPVCHAVHPTDPIVWTPLDEKPKTVDDPLALARVRDIRRDPRVTLLVDRWSEAWTQLAWLRCQGHATLLDAGGPDGAEHDAAVAALGERYPQYAAHDLASRPVIRITIQRLSSWGVSET